MTYLTCIPTPAKQIYTSSNYDWIEVPLRQQKKLAVVNVDRHGLAFSRPLVQGQVSAPRASEAILSAATRLSNFQYKSKNDVVFCVKSDVYPSKFRSKDVKMRKSTKQRVIIPKVSRSFTNRIGDWRMAARRAAAKVPIESCTKSYQHMRDCAALRIDPNMSRVRCLIYSQSTCSNMVCTED